MEETRTEQQNTGTNQNHHFQDNFNHIKKSLTDTAQHAKSKAEEMLHQAQDKTSELQENLIVYIRHNPMKAIGTAVLIGFVAGLLARR